jgi:hypothetical protein
MFTSDQRIAMSSKIVSIPLENQIVDETLLLMNAQIQKMQDEDSSNKLLGDSKDALINPYQNEAVRYDGNIRTVLTETEYQNSSKKTLGNVFFPNNPQIVLPSLPDGVYKAIIPFSNTYAVGKNYNESYTTTRKESDIISDIQAKITELLAYPEIQRVTGQICTTVTVTPEVGPPISTDTISSNAALQTASTQLTGFINELKSFIASTKSIINANTDTNPSRVLEMTVAKDNIDNATVNLDSWLILPEYDNTHGQSTCPLFNSYNPDLLIITKLKDESLSSLQTYVANRLTHSNERMGQVLGHLGGVTQNATTGEVSSYLGFYGDRFRIINMRLNIMGGSLSKLQSSSFGVSAQEQAKESNNNALAVYNSIINCKKFTAPSGGHKKIVLENTTGLTVGMPCYVSANNQQEISANIVSISGNVVELDTIVPKKYTESSLARLYVML